MRKHGNATHGESRGTNKTELYRKWAQMKHRCGDITNLNYNGKGIQVHPDWLGKGGYERFKEWALANGWKDGCGLQPDRYPNREGNYESSNIRFVPNQTNQNNKSNNRWYSINGIEQTLQQWCNDYKISYHTVWRRLKIGWDIEKALSTPIRERTYK